VNPSTPAFDQIPDDEPVTFMPLETVWADSRVDTSRSRPKSEVSTGYVRFVNGDILSPKVTPTFQAGRSALITTMTTLAGAASTEVHVVRARPGLADPRFVRYGLLTKPFLDGGVSRFQGVAGLQRVPDEFLRDVALRALEIAEQRRIADFLDDRVARIDSIIAARDFQRRLFAERSAGLLQELLAEWGCQVRPGEAIETQRLTLPVGWRIAELGHVVRQLTNGYVGPTRDLLVDEGVRYIQSLHIKNGRIDFARRPYFVPHDWHFDRPRIHLRPDDVLIVQTGDIGQIAVVPEDIGEASCHALLIARAEPGVVTGKFLGEYLRTPAGQQELLSRATGALHPHLESGIKAATVIVPPDDAQRRAVSEVRVRRDQLESLDAALARSNAELAELKRSLITAAVTGEFDVWSADGSRARV
jgi:type I restriction enzyme S subunit